MKRNILTCFFLVLITLVFSCTSFVYDGDVSCRGMNFDYESNPEVKIRIEQFNNQRAFIVSFKTPIGYANVIGINDSGVFATTQALSKRYFKSDGRPTIFIHDVFLEQIKNATEAAYLERFVQDKRVRFSPMMYTHIMVADKFGHAIALEVGEKENELVKKDGPIFAMANFPLYKFMDKDFDEVFGRGDQNYINVWKALLDKADESFDLETAMYVLKQAVCSTTECSVIFFPETFDIFLSFDGKFDRIWQISLQRGTIKTHRGFKEDRQTELTSRGLLKSELIGWE